MVVGFLFIYILIFCPLHRNSARVYIKAVHLLANVKTHTYEQHIMTTGCMCKFTQNDLGTQLPWQKRGCENIHNMYSNKNVLKVSTLRPYTATERSDTKHT